MIQAIDQVLEMEKRPILELSLICLENKSNYSSSKGTKFNSYKSTLFQNS